MVMQVGGVQGEEVVAKCSEVLRLRCCFEGYGLVIEAHPFEQSARTSREVVGTEVADLRAVNRASRVGIEEGLLSVDVDIELIEPRRLQWGKAVVYVIAASEHLVVSIVIRLVLRGEYVSGLHRPYFGVCDLILTVVGGGELVVSIAVGYLAEEALLAVFHRVRSGGEDASSQLSCPEVTHLVSCTLCVEGEGFKALVDGSATE